jgi:glycerol 3-phosphatase-2
MTAFAELPDDAPADAPEAFARYEAIRHRLPRVCLPTHTEALRSLEDVADHVDGFLLDAFGVLNIGDRAVAGAVARMRELRARGRRLMVLTNAASFPTVQLVDKYHRLGFDFAHDEVVSSRDVAAARLEAIAPGATWAAIPAEGDSFGDLPAAMRDAVADPAALDEADAVLFLSSSRWTPALQALLLDALRRRPRPVVVANPDLVAPQGSGALSREPGWFAHALPDDLQMHIQWFGKPFPDAFRDAIARTALPPARLAMAGDTLHTDVLGGAAAGCRTALVTGHGLFAGHDVRGFVRSSGLTPDFMLTDP